MNDKAIIVGAVVFIVICVGFVLFHTGYIQSKADNSFPLGDQSDLALTGLIELDVVLADGTVKTLLGENPEKLSFQYDGDKVEKVTWRLKAQANSPIEPFDQVQFDFKATENNEVSVSQNYRLLIQILPAGGVNTVWSQYFTLETLQYKNIPVDGSFHVLHQETVDLADKFTMNEDFGLYSINFVISGSFAYRGLDNNYNNPHGSWKTVNMNQVGYDGVNCGYQFEYVEREVTIDFEKEVYFIDSNGNKIYP